jgi:hypothetical protein
MALLANRPNGLSDALHTKDLFRRKSIVASASQSNIVNCRTAAEGMGDAVVEFEKVSTFAATALAVHIGALSSVTFPDFSPQLRRQIS